MQWVEIHPTVRLPFTKIFSNDVASPLARFLIGLGVAAASVSGHAQSLADLYQQANAYDATLQSAQKAYAAAQAKAGQAHAGKRPSLGFSAGLGRSQVDYAGATPANRHYTTQSAALQANQALYRPAVDIGIDQANLSVQTALAQQQAAEQDLMLRVAQAMFDNLTAQAALSLIQEQKKAVTEQLKAAQHNFEIGTSTITDTREAQARYDLIVAQELSANNDLRIKQLTLEQLVGNSAIKPYALQTKDLSPWFQTQRPLDEWVSLALQNHPTAAQAQLNFNIAKLETQKARTAYKPTIDATAQLQQASNPSGSSSATTRGNTTSVGVQLNWPLFSGYAVQNRIKETLALEDKAQADLEVIQRALAQSVRTAYYAVQSGLAQIKALQTAEQSSLSALAANQLGYQVGVRINIDVLNAQAQLFQTRRDLNKAQYDLLLAYLKLLQNSGQLQAQHLQDFNAIFTPH
jgi:outer membrane protein